MTLLHVGLVGVRARPDATSCNFVVHARELATPDALAGIAMAVTYR